MTRSLDQRWDDLLFGVRLSSRYHERRRRFFLSWNRTVSFVIALLGAASVAALLREAGSELLVLLAGLLVMAAATLNLVFETAQRVAEHQSLGREFVLLERRMALAEATGRTLAEFTAERLEIEAREPAIGRVLASLSHNDVMRAMGYPPEEWVRVSPWQRRLAQYFDFRADRLTGEPTVPDAPA